MPNITGGFWDLITNLGTGHSRMGTASGVFYTPYFNLSDPNAISTITDSSGFTFEIENRDGIGFTASRASSVYTNGGNVLPASLTLNNLIKA